MKLGIMQPYFFPYIGYWQLLNAVDEYVIFDDVNYIKKGWINRNYILFNGEAKRINLNIKDASQNRLIKDTEIACTSEDINRILSIIKQGYCGAPHFKEVYNRIGDILNCNYKCLSEFLTYQIESLCDYLQISTKLILSSNITKDNTLKGESKIIDICKRRGADLYINAVGGKALYSRQKFYEENIALKFLVNTSRTYEQFGNDFIANLSIIDIMMFNNVGEIKELLLQFVLED